MSFNFNLGVQFKQDEAPTNKVVGDRWYDTINEECFEWSGTDWNKCIPVGENAYIAGGYTTGSTYLNSIESFAFPFDVGTAVVVGALNQSVREFSGCNSTTHGYFFGGYSGSRESNIERIEFPFDSGTSAAVGNLAVQSYQTAACNSSQHGYVMSGRRYNNDARDNTIERITFPFDSGPTSSGGFFSDVYTYSSCQGLNSSTHGYMVGGGFLTSSVTSYIFRMQFPFEFGQMSIASYSAGAEWQGHSTCNSSSHGYIMGDASGVPEINSIYRFSFPFTSVAAALVGNIVPSHGYSAGVNSSSHGFICGGRNTTTFISICQRFDFPFDSGIATVVGNLATEKSYSTGVDEADFVEIFTEAPTPETATNFGYIAGGAFYAATYMTKNIQRITFPFTSGVANVTAELADYHTSSGGLNSTTYGYVIAGLQTSSTPNSNIEKFAFPFNSGTANVVGIIGGSSSRRSNPFSFNSSAHGYLSGGFYTGTSNYSDIQRFEFPFDSGATIQVGFITSAITVNRGSGASCNSSTHGYMMGGVSSTSYPTINLQRLQFPFDTGIVSVIGDMNGTTAESAGCNSSLRGYTMGGRYSYSIVKRFSFPFMSGSATDIGNLAATRREGVGLNSTVHGYIAGGYRTNNFYPDHVVERMVFPFASGTLTEVGYLRELTQQLV